METTTEHYAAIWSICVLHGSALTGGVDIECTLHIFIVLTICAPKIIKFGGDSTKFWQKQVGSFLHTLYI